MVISVLVASVVAFVVSAGWYMAFGSVWARLSPAGAAAGPSPWRMGLEFVRTAVLVTAFALLSVDVDGVAGSLGFALAVWAGFPVVILAGSVLHERVPVGLAALHAGDWLVKLTVVAVVLGLWR
ncbi:DUF1761 domain-containing protein [Amycolatopsis tolypomycina]|uniref:DUF1761 domain-containing protein n=1 Tax=Amycolatopsis tolypomycina TaxID=208445 RepID=A0A1H4P3Q8_9PSEU|nr:DUF1761 domain-containing protein [Amycolatopsis tolypomycina]SEC02097.1 Protein of unknown function [Amycolatopsis tolypomycina]